MTWTLETVLPLAGLGLLAVALPVGLARHLPDSHRALLAAVAASALLMVLAGAGLFLALYLIEGAPAGALHPVHLLGLGVKAGLVWAPILGLAALGLAQRIEARRGQAAAARDPD